MYVTLIVNLITFVGNLLLLYGWFGLPQLGVAGVAISTVAGRIVGVVLLVWLVARKTGIRLRLPEIVKPSRLMLGRCCTSACRPPARTSPGCCSSWW